MKTKVKKYKILLIVVLCILVCGLSAVFSIDAYVLYSAKDAMISSEEAANLKDTDCIIVLGCQVKPDGTPSHMLRDRLERSIELYNLGAAPKLLMSGDHGQKEYDEVNTMKNYAVAKGIPSSDVFMDHAGFSTYETMYRAKEIFGVKKAVIVTQKYHLYRALYIAERLGIEAYGVPADYRTYSGQVKRDIREILARCKDFATTIFLPEPTYGGNPIPVSGDGNITNDKLA